MIFYALKMTAVALWSAVPFLGRKLIEDPFLLYNVVFWGGINSLMILFWQQKTSLKHFAL